MSIRSKAYNADSYELPDSLDTASKIFPVGKNIAVLGLKENNGVSDIKLEIFDESGTVKCENTIYSVDSTSENYRAFEFMRCSSNENIISAEIEFTNEGKNLFYIVKYDPERVEKLSETDLKNVPEIFAENYDGIFCGSNGNTFIYSKNILAVFNVNGNLLYNIEYPSNPMEPSLIKDVYETSDGRIFAEINSLINNNDKHSKETELILIDTENMTFGKKYPVSSGDDFISGNYGSDLIYLNKNGIYGYDIDSGKEEIIIDLIRSGIDVQTFPDNSKIALLPDKKAVCISENDEQQKLIILTKADNSDAAKKEKITLYAIYLDNNVKKQAPEFNKNNNKYEIELVDYAPDTEDRHGAASERLNLDLAAGKIPDIIEFDTGFYVEQTFPKESYMSKGMFADLYGFIDNDPEFNKDDFLPDIFGLFEFNGKLYEAVPFSI